jgi:aspartate/methionine/tyrosine aminotransferase
LSPKPIDASKATVSVPVSVKLACTPCAELSWRLGLVLVIRSPLSTVRVTVKSSWSCSVVEPDGAFYLFIRIGDSTASDPEPGTTFSKRLLEEAHVAVVPGIAFRTPEWIRVSYAAPAEQVLEGVRRIIGARIS